jgi:DNA-binding ferritin-like protein
MADIFQTAIEAPRQEIITEEVVVTKEASPENLVFGMVSFASYLYQLNTQAHLLHLNIECPQFLALHEFLKEQYEQHIADFDVVAELVRSMDFLMPMCQCGLMDAYKKFKSVKTYDAKDSLTLYTKNLEAGAQLAVELVDMAKEANHPDVENEVAAIVGKLFKSAWMLKSTLRNA